jgi:hypothetical protein
MGGHEEKGCQDEEGGHDKEGGHPSIPVLSMGRGIVVVVAALPKWWSLADRTREPSSSRWRAMTSVIWAPAMTGGQPKPHSTDDLSIVINIYRL